MNAQTPQLLAGLWVKVCWVAAKKHHRGSDKSVVFTMTAESRLRASERPTSASSDVDTDLLDAIQRRVLWLAVRMVDEANKSDAGGIKVGGHQASSASIVSVMTALWFSHLRQADKVSVKPHASPVYHAIKYLTGELDKSYLTKLRAYQGLQAYPSRTKDPDVADFSTGSVGLGAVAPLFSAAARRYAEARFGPLPSARFFALLGDAELDEGNVWEAVAEPATEGLSNVTLVVDLNRQSLDRVVPGIRAVRLQRRFEAVGWHVAEAKYGARLHAVFADVGGEAVRDFIDTMSNEKYQALFSMDNDTLRQHLYEDADSAVRKVFEGFGPADLRAHVFDLGGHDIGLLARTFEACDRVDNTPSVLFAYTIKGWGLPIAGRRMNHSTHLSTDQIQELRQEVGLTTENEWDRFDPTSPEGQLCASVGGDLNSRPPSPRPKLSFGSSVMEFAVDKAVSTQEAFGRVITRVADQDESGRVVTVSPDVSVSTNLGGWINKVGVFSPSDSDAPQDAGLLRWKPSREGQHIELGISEMNLFLLLGQLGLSHEHHDKLLLPVGTVYDPFVLRGLDAFIHSVYNGARFIIAGTPSGVTLAPEGGAHQSTITPSVGLELPGVSFYEPAYAQEVDWIMCHAFERLTGVEGESSYLRLSTRPIDQAPIGKMIADLGASLIARDVVKGGYRIKERVHGDQPGVTIVAMGAIMPEALAAATELESEGVSAAVVNVTSSDHLYAAWRRRVAVSQGSLVKTPSHLHKLIPPRERVYPIVSVHDAASHHLAWIGSALGVPQTALGVDRFGESGTISDLYMATGIDTGSIVNAALIAVLEGDASTRGQRF